MPPEVYVFKNSTLGVQNFTSLSLRTPAVGQDTCVAEGEGQGSRDEGWRCRWPQCRCPGSQDPVAEVSGVGEGERWEISLDKGQIRWLVLGLGVELPLPRDVEQNGLRLPRCATAVSLPCTSMGSPGHPLPPSDSCPLPRSGPLQAVRPQVLRLSRAHHA